MFASEVQFLFDDVDHQHGSLDGEDHRGVLLSSPLTSLSVGAVMVEPELYSSHMEVSVAASEAKKQAKRIGGNALFVERRSPRHTLRL